MDIFDSDYFVISKKLAICVGLWPYDSCKKYFLGIFWLSVGILTAIPQVIGAKVHFSDLDMLIEHILMIIFITGCFFKLFTLLISEKELRIMYKGIVDNWGVVVDAEEKAILSECSERGTKIAGVYCVFLVSGVLVVILPPLIPIALNKIVFHTEKLPYIYIFNGEFLVDDRDSHYWQIYFCDVMLMLFILMIVMGVDSMYIVCIEHCIGVFTVIKYRLQLPGKLVDDRSIEEDNSYDYVVQIIRLHKMIIKFSIEFADTLEASYSKCFLIILLLEIGALPTACYLIISNLKNPVSCIRFAIAFNCLMVHYFALCIPAQRLADTSSNIFSDAYCSEWYKSSPRTKKLLWILIHRSERPCILTAGGLAIMGSENYMRVQKTALSYVTFLCSFN